ncbi:MAG: DUF6527 family protein [Myxococcales bacterium]
MPKTNRTADGATLFWCPGCDEPHALNDTWTISGTPESPTFSPSVLVTSGHYVDGNTETCWCTYEARSGKRAPFKCDRCHSFVRDGRIEFLSDSTHKLAGQTVELPKWPYR